MYDLTDPKIISMLKRRFKFEFSKSLGQNFIIDKDLCPQIAALAIPSPKTCVVEIGPGVGVLTKELAKRCEKLVSVEIDKSLLPILAETLKEADNVEVINDDILKVDLKSLLDEHFGEKDVVICANLPYYITSPIVMKLLEERDKRVRNITVMVQKEAGERICAPIP